MRQTAHGASVSVGGRDTPSNRPLFTTLAAARHKRFATRI